VTQAPGKVAKTASHPFGRDTGSDHGLRGRPTIHPDGCSSSRFRSRSMPSRMKDETFLYLVYGASCLIHSHVA